MNAVAIPLLADKVDDWKAWISDCTGPRLAEFESFNQRMGLTKHRVWLDEGPHGPQAIVMHEGPGADAMLKNLAVSKHSFDIWFRDRISEYHGMNFSKESKEAPPRLLMNWIGEKKAREAGA